MLKTPNTLFEKFNDSDFVSSLSDLSLLKNKEKQIGHVVTYQSIKESFNGFKKILENTAKTHDLSFKILDEFFRLEKSYITIKIKGLESDVIYFLALFSDCK